MSQTNENPIPLTLALIDFENAFDFVYSKKKREAKNVKK